LEFPLEATRTCSPPQPNGSSVQDAELEWSAPEDQAAIRLMDRVSLLSTPLRRLAGQSGSGPRATGALRIFYIATVRIKVGLSSSTDAVSGLRHPEMRESLIYR